MVIISKMTIYKTKIAAKFILIIDLDVFLFPPTKKKFA